MFTLVSSQGSPFGRKVRMVADILGITDQISLQGADLRDPEDPIRRINPLGKIPALIPDDGAPIFDSRVIVGYLCDRFGGDAIIPADPEARVRALTLAAMAEGITDALILIAVEPRYHQAEQISTGWLDLQYGKVRRGFEAAVDSLDEFKAPGVAAITLACALGYADYRKQIDWRAEYPAFVPWVEDFAAAVPFWHDTLRPED